MIVLKVIGCCCVATTCSGIGWYLSLLEKRKIRWLRELTECIVYIESSLQFAAADVISLVSGCADRTSGKLRQVFLCLLAQLQKQELPNVSGCMRLALADIPMPELLAELLSRLGNQLGQFDVAGQIAVLEPVKNDCANAYSNAFANQNMLIRNYRTLGICSGLVIVILLI